MLSLISKCTEMCSLNENALLNLLNVPLNYLLKFQAHLKMFYMSVFVYCNCQVLDVRRGIISRYIHLLWKG